MKILVIGSGGREHALVWKISQSSKADKIYCIPGNAGIAKTAECISLDNNPQNLLDFAISKKIDLTVVGPEVPLSEGIVDLFNSKNIKIFGPTKELAKLESSKVFTKEIAKKCGVPTADFRIFSNAAEAKEFIKEKGAPIVVKADGLAAGKGSIVAKTVDEAFRAVDKIIVEKIFGKAGEKIVIEDCLIGEEASILAVCDGKIAVPLASTQDHKRAYDGDRGPNTGGMGAYSPTPCVSKKILDKTTQKIINPVIHYLSESGKIFKGILYAGIMIVKDEPYLIEFNVRFGDPETQVILPRLDTDIVDVILASIDGTLNKIKMKWKEEHCMTVVVASGGYPGDYEKGKVITGLNKIDLMKDVFVFHAGTKQQNAEIVTNGGRVLNVTALGNTLKEAAEKCYKTIEEIKFDKMFFRKDIGYCVLKNQNQKQYK